MASFLKLFLHHPLESNAFSLSMISHLRCYFQDSNGSYYGNTKRLFKGTLMQI